MRPLPKRIWLVLAAAFAGLAAARADDLAVNRGQTSFNPRGLPLVCLEVCTVNAAVPLDSVIITDLAKGRDQRLDFSDPAHIAHAKLLTALGPAKESLSLPIFHLKPGRYVIRSLVFVVGPSFSDHSVMTFGVGTDAHPVWFEVKPGCVNLVGGISISADWANTGVSRLPGSLAGVSQHSFAARISTTSKVARDAKWACAQVPCIAGLPTVVSLIRRD